MSEILDLVSVGDWKRFRPWRDMIICVFWKSLSAYTYDEQRNNSELETRKPAGGCSTGHEQMNIGDFLKNL